MRRGRIFFYLAFILILGLVGVAVVYTRFIQPSQAIPTTTTEGAVAPAAPVETVNVVVTAQRVTRGSMVDETVISSVPMPAGTAMQGLYTDAADVVGRQAKFDLEPGTPLTASMLVEDAAALSAAGSNAALTIPKGMVAVSVPISRLSSVSYAPQPGDHVNVIVTLLMVDLDTDTQTKLPNTTGTVIAPGAAGEGQPETLTMTVNGPNGAQGHTEIDPVLGQSVYLMPSEGQRPRMASQTLLQDAVVLQMGNFPTQDQAAQQAADAAAEGETRAETAPAATIPEVVTLIVTPQDAVTLNYLIYSGAKIALALRSASDDTRIQTEAVTLQFLLDQYRIPVPVKLPYGLEPRIDVITEPVPPTTAAPEQLE